VPATTTLPTRPLGLGGPEITTTGFGAWALGGGDWAFSWGPQDDDASIAAILHAVDRGITWIDTAAVYGLGHSEEVVGRALQRIPAADRPLVFTKCGLLRDESDRHADARRDLRPESIRRECDESLRRLGVDVIDLYQFHWPDETGTPVEESWGTMLELIAAGKVRAGGVSNFDVPLLERCEAIGHVTSLQPPFSMISRAAAADVLPWCGAHGTGVIAYSPMQSGLLTGAFSAERMAALAADDWRRRSADFQSPQLERSLALVSELEPIAARHGVGLPALAVAWVLAFPEVSGAIVGARSPEQVDGWIAGASLELDERDLGDVAAAIERTGAGQGPSLPIL
jgi:aryl-alcohol dehydrogenase-like predicted oxidoreductase